jgi:hypothetical protein
MKYAGGGQDYNRLIVFRPGVPRFSLLTAATLMRGASSNIRRALCNPCRRQGSSQVLVRYFSDRPNSIGHEDRDVVIVGGGPAGLALASALGGYPLVILNGSSIFTHPQHQIIPCATP